MLPWPVPQPPIIMVNAMTKPKARRDLAHFAAELSDTIDNERNWNRQRIMTAPLDRLGAAFGDTVGLFPLQM